MIQISKYLNSKTFLAEYIVKNHTKSTDLLGDFWTGVIILQNLVKNKQIYYKDQPLLGLNGLYFLISDNSFDYLQFYKDIWSFKSDNFYDNMEKETLTILNPFIIINNLCDLEIQDLIKIKNKFIQSYEGERYERNYTLSAVICSSIIDYFDILGSKTEKRNGSLAYSLPIFCDKPKCFGQSIECSSRYREYFDQLVQFAATGTDFTIGDNGFRQYRKYVTHRTREKGFYGLILEDLKDFYCLKLAAFLAFNNKRYEILEEDVENSIKIINVTMDRALDMFKNGIYDERNTGKIENALKKIKKFLLIEGQNGMQHRTLYLKVHHDIDNDTFKYLMNLLHELGLIEKLKVSNTSIIYRASDTLADLDLQKVLGEIKLFE